MVAPYHCFVLKFPLVLALMFLIHNNLIFLWEKWFIRAQREKKTSFYELYQVSLECLSSDGGDFTQIKHSAP